jgi:hypothetical protein
MSLDGQVGTQAIAELDGGGRTTLIADGLQWQLLRAVDLDPVTIPTATGIHVDPPDNLDKYLVEFTRPGPSAQYVMRWIVPVFGNVDEGFTSSLTVPGVSDFVPTVDEVGALIRSRTLDNAGNEIGSFNDNTRPTGPQADILIAQAYDDVIAKYDDDIPLASARDARTVIAIRAAMLIELSYWPKEVASGRSTYTQLHELYLEALENLGISIAREAEEAIEGEQPPTPLRPVWYFDQVGAIGLRTPW